MAAAPSEEPLTLASFEIGRALGAGQFGRVFLARHPTLGLVALKVLSKGALARAGAAHLLRREIEVHSRLRHPHVLPFLGCFHDATRVYIALALASGGTLHSRLRSGGALSDTEAAGVIAAMAEALAYLHGEGLVHRDIKPENILLTGKGEPLLADYGFAASTLTRRTTLAGTLAFAAPEVLAGGAGGERRAHGPPADVWSLGMLAAELLAPGRAPFGGRDPAEALRSIEAGAWAPPPGASPAASAFIARCLVLEPSGRPSAEQCLEDAWLAPHARGEGGGGEARRAGAEEAHQRIAAAAALVAEAVAGASAGAAGGPAGGSLAAGGGGGGGVGGDGSRGGGSPPAGPSGAGSSGSSSARRLSPLATPQGRALLSPRAGQQARSLLSPRSGGGAGGGARRPPAATHSAASAATRRPGDALAVETAAASAQRAGSASLPTVHASLQALSPPAGGLQSRAPPPALTPPSEARAQGAPHPDVTPPTSAAQRPPPPAALEDCLGGAPAGTSPPVHALAPQALLSPRRALGAPLRVRAGGGCVGGAGAGAGAGGAEALVSPTHATALPPFGPAVTPTPAAPAAIVSPPVMAGSLRRHLLGGRAVGRAPAAPPPWR